jgi:hypothetical protein
MSAVSVVARAGPLDREQVVAVRRHVGARRLTVRPDRNWIDNWRLDIAPARERSASAYLLKVFGAFWESEGLDEKSSSTSKRYSAGLHALGGHIVRRAASPDDLKTSVEDLLAEALDGGEGPLIHYDNETWQRELDTMCRKLHKYLTQRQ